ncbi:MAG: hypothetical protein Kilf2KO_41590 [Rhodospirillales bacterium]
MSTGPIDDWAGGLSDVGPIYPLPGTEGLWAGIAIVFLIWWIMACLRMDQQTRSQAQDEFGEPERLRELLDAMEGDPE